MDVNEKKLLMVGEDCDVVDVILFFFVYDLGVLIRVGFGLFGLRVSCVDPVYNPNTTYN